MMTHYNSKRVVRRLRNALVGIAIVIGSLVIGVNAFAATDAELEEKRASVLEERDLVRLHVFCYIVGSAKGEDISRHVGILSNHTEEYSMFIAYYQGYYTGLSEGLGGVPMSFLVLYDDICLSSA